MTTRFELERLLPEMPEIDIESISVVGDFILIAIVVSPSFSHQDEALHQEKAWKYLSDKLDPDELGNVEFIFTSTPEEIDAVSAPTSVA